LEWLCIIYTGYQNHIFYKWKLY